MTNEEYSQKKRECWEEYKRENLDGEVQWQPVSRYDVFCDAFDRGATIGKQKETITSEEVAKNASEYADGIKLTSAIPGALVPFIHDIAYNSYICGMMASLGKQEKDADTVIQGWVARDEDNTLTLFYGSNKPSKEDGDDYWSAVFGNTLEYLPQEMFPDVTWNDPEPTRVELIIKRKKK